MMAIWWNWHICFGMLGNRDSKPFLPSQTMAFMSNPACCKNNSPDSIQTVRFILNELLVKVPSAIGIFEQHHAKGPTKICCVHQYGHLTFFKDWLFYLHLVKPSLNCFDGAAMLCAKLLVSLLSLYVLLPQQTVVQALTTQKLFAAGSTFVQLNTFDLAIFLCDF
jgi:hypothetical protein